MQSDENEVLRRLKNDVIMFDHEDIVPAAMLALDMGIPREKIITDALMPGMEEVGRRYESDEYFLPDLIMASEAMTEAVKNLFKDGESDEKTPKVLLATVKGDIHDIGKNLLGNYLGGMGIGANDLGVDVSAEEVADAVERLQPKVLALSSMLSNTRVEIATIITTLKKRGLRKGLNIIVGGCSTGRVYALKTGADAYAKDAFKGSTIIKGWL